MALGVGTGRSGKTGLLFRPIVKELWSDDAMAAGELAINQGMKLSAARSSYNQFMNTASSGSVIARTSLGGGVYYPRVAPRNPGNLGSA